MTKKRYKLSLTRKRKIAEYYVYNNSTIRKTADHFGISKSYVHRALMEFQQDKSTAGTELALKVASQIKNNVEARAFRGGTTTKNKYSKCNN